MKIDKMLMSMIFLSLLFSNAKTGECVREILNTFGMKGRAKSKFTMMEMCPLVKETCCEKEDQLQIFGNWEAGKERERIEKQFSATFLIYEALFKQLKIIHGFARQVEEKLAAKKISNCKFLANRIKSFRAPLIGKKLKKHFVKMQKFMVDSYKGFYCSLCDYKNHKYIVVKGSKFVYSEGFCRDMTEATLIPLLYFHSHINKLLNLVTRFMTSCDFKGEFKLDIPIKKEFIFKTDPKIFKELDECKTFRNKKRWFVYCGDICNKFNVMKFDPFFEPNKLKIAEYVVHLKKLVKAYIDEKKKMPLFGPVRMLAAKAPAKKAAPAPAGKKDAKKKKKLPDKLLLLIKALKKQKKDPVFKEDPAAVIKASAYRSSFQTFGIDLCESGKASLFTETMFNQIKTIVNLKKLASQKGSGLTRAQRKMIQKMAGEWKMGVFSMIVMGLMFVWKN